MRRQVGGGPCVGSAWSLGPQRVAGSTTRAQDASPRAGPSRGYRGLYGRGLGEVSRRGRATAACGPQASHPLKQQPWLAVTLGDAEKSGDARLEAE